MSQIDIIILFFTQILLVNEYIVRFIYINKTKLYVGEGWKCLRLYLQNLVVQNKRLQYILLYTNYLGPRGHILQILSNKHVEVIVNDYYWLCMQCEHPQNTSSVPFCSSEVIEGGGYRCGCVVKVDRFQHILVTFYFWIPDEPKESYFSLGYN